MYLLLTLHLALTIEQDYRAYTQYPLLSPLAGFADNTNLTVAHTAHEPHTPDIGPTVSQQASNLLDVTISYLSHNKLIVHPTKSVAMIKGSATASTLRPQGPPMHVVQATTNLGVIQTTNPDDTTLPPKVAVTPRPPPRDIRPPPPRRSPYHTKGWRTTSPGC